jgi:hypothetical protein
MATTPNVSANVSAGSPAPTQTFEELFAPALLRKTARIIRAEIRQIRARDVVDWVDCEEEPGRTVARALL